MPDEEFCIKGACPYCEAEILFRGNVTNKERTKEAEGYKIIVFLKSAYCDNCSMLVKLSQIEDDYFLKLKVEAKKH